MKKQFLTNLTSEKIARHYETAASLTKSKITVKTGYFNQKTNKIEKTKDYWCVFTNETDLNRFWFVYDLLMK